MDVSAAAIIVVAPAVAVFVDKHVIKSFFFLRFTSVFSRRVYAGNVSNKTPQTRIFFILCFRVIWYI